MSFLWISPALNGVHYSHSDMWIDNPYSGTITGNFICNGNMHTAPLDSYFGDVTLQYSDRAAKGQLPPGFEFLGTSNGTPKLIKWSEE